MFDSIFANTASTTSVELGPLLVGVGVSLLLGLVLALAYCYRSKHTKSFVTTLAILPAIVCVVIAMVNGNVGAGVAVAGAFSLVRFRSVPGSARDIAFIFLAMCVGLVTGMGYLVCAVAVTLVLCAIATLYQALSVGPLGDCADRALRITVPEDLDFYDLFDDVLDKYTTYHELLSVKTTNMGSLYKLVYNVGMRDLSLQRNMIDELRCRNGNLEIALSHQEANNDEL
ncbi:MAG: DUF4956 domain-containing protein [Coriobacteriales bacterium]|nr:DUF4956 domain-containing protein [Coriobacteriales bacterium]